MARETVRVHVDAAASAQDIWAIAGAFAAAWHPAVARMWEEPGAGGGLIRAFHVAGEDTVYRERLTYFSDTDRHYRYTHVAGIEGIDAYHAEFRVADRAEGCTITMSAEVEAPAPRAQEVAQGTKMIFESGLQALSASTSRPAPVPVALPPPVPMETRRVPGAPELALSVTPLRQGPLCLFLHGIGGARGNWDQQLVRAGAVTPAAALDLRGYGNSGAGPASIEAYCNDILRVRAALGADQLVLCGLSYGAWIATSFAMRYPRLLAGLVLSGGCTGMSEAPDEVRLGFRKARLGPLDAGQVPADFAPAVVDTLAGPQADATVRQALHASMAAIPPGTYREAVRCFTAPSERFDFARLTMPVLIMTGAFDKLAPPVELRGIAERIHSCAPRANVRFEVLDGAGHVCNIEAPDAYSRHLVHFLRRLGP